MKKSKEMEKLEAEIIVIEKKIEYYKELSKSSNQELVLASKSFLRADTWDLRKCQLALLALTR